jgi:hypothetical protein
MPYSFKDVFERIYKSGTAGKAIMGPYEKTQVFPGSSGWIERHSPNLPQIDGSKVKVVSSNLTGPAFPLSMVFILSA